jgi:F-type H+-transporting ATPase subunit alpha
MPIHHKELAEEVGFVTAAKDYLLLLEGLPSVRVNDVIENDEGFRALVLALNQDRVQALLLDEAETYAGDRFFIREHGISLSLGDHLLGRTINAVGDALDEASGFPPGNTTLRLEMKAPDINTRADITEQLKTGVTLVDTLIPIGKGQRQLIAGPFGSGKELFLQDVVMNQRDSDIVCIYAFIGKPLIYVQEVMQRLFAREGGNKNIIALAALSHEPAPMVFVAPSSALSVAEHFSNQGKDVLVILDDLGTHARYLREIELLAGRIPGRESYPGDIFYQHAHIMERSGKFNKNAGGGSITLLPVLETNIEELSDLIATNIMAATDGHIFFSSELHAEGYYPSVNVGQSVTRVGRKTQNRLLNALSIRIQVLLADYEQQKTFSRFGAQVSAEAHRVIARGEMMEMMLQQELATPIPVEQQVILLGSVLSSVFHKKKSRDVERVKLQLLQLIGGSSFKDLVTTAKRGVMSLDQFIKELDKRAEVFDRLWQR